MEWIGLVQIAPSSYSLDKLALRNIRRIFNILAFSRF
jgi:hypothetical protein